jgi:hypothetical protein
MDDIVTPSAFSFNKVDKDKYIIEYTAIPGHYIARIRAKTLIPGVNPCLESELYYFKTFEEMENFFKQLTQSS